MRFYILQLMLIISTTLAAQNSDSQVRKQEQMEREALQQKRAEMVRRYERDPQRFMDSVRQVKAQEDHEEALSRLDRYRTNTRKDTITQLDLSNAGLDRVPAWVYDFVSIQTLVIDNNRISKLPGKLRKLDSLQEVSWNSNELNSRRKIGRWLDIRRISMANSDMKKMPPIRRLKALEYLDASGNALKELPLKQLSASDRLREIVLKNNPLGSLEVGKYSRWTGVEVLKLNKCELTSIDPSFYLVPNLKELQLQENPLTVIPEGISNMDSLEKISFYKCSLVELPDDFFSIPHLVIADLYYNNLKRIPNSVGQAKRVEVLFLSHNQLIEIPDEIGSLPALQELYLHNNKLSYLPDAFRRLQGLKVLRINNNLIQQFPDQIIQLTGLTDLDLDDNLIERIPDSIGELVNLNLFTFDGNPINFNDPANQSFMKQVSRLEQSGTICKPSIQMNYVDAEGSKIDL